MYEINVTKAMRSVVKTGQQGGDTMSYEYSTVQDTVPYCRPLYVDIPV